MNVEHWFDALRREVQSRAYILRLDILDHSRNKLKARLIISPDLFVQVYRNDLYDTTNSSCCTAGVGSMRAIN